MQLLYSHCYVVAAAVILPCIDCTVYFILLLVCDNVIINDNSDEDENCVM